MRFKDEVHIWAKLNPFSARHGEQPIVIQDRIQRLDPLRVDIAIADDPGVHLCFQSRRVETSVQQGQLEMQGTNLPAAP